MPEKSVKDQAVADFFAYHLALGSSELYDDLSDEIAEVCTIHAPSEEQVWQLSFDDASRTGPRGNIIVGAGVVPIFPHNCVTYCAFSLIERCSNNVVEYNTLLIGMHLVNEIRVTNLEAYGDSKLIVNQV